MKLTTVLLFCLLVNFSIADKDLAKPDEDLKNLGKQIHTLEIAIDPVEKNIHALDNNVITSVSKLNKTLQNFEETVNTARKSLNNFTNPFCEEKYNYLKKYDCEKQMTTNITKEYTKTIEPVKQITQSFHDLQAHFKVCEDNITKNCVDNLKKEFGVIDLAWNNSRISDVNTTIKELLVKVSNSFNLTSKQLTNLCTDGISDFENLAKAKTKIDAISNSDITKLVEDIKAHNTTAQDEVKNITEKFNHVTLVICSSPKLEISVLKDEARAAGVDISACRDPNFDALRYSSIKNFTKKITIAQNKNEQNVSQSTDLILKYKPNAYKNLTICTDLNCITKIETQTDFNEIKSVQNASLIQISSFIYEANSIENISENETSNTILSIAKVTIDCIDSAMKPTRDTLQNLWKQIQKLKIDIDPVEEKINTLDKNINDSVSSLNKTLQNFEKAVNTSRKDLNEFKNPFCEQKYNNLKKYDCGKQMSTNITEPYTKKIEPIKKNVQQFNGLQTNFMKCNHSITKTCVDNLKKEFEDFNHTWMNSNISEAKTTIEKLLLQVNSSSDLITKQLTDLCNDAISGYQILTEAKKKIDAIDDSFITNLVKDIETHDNKAQDEVKKIIDKFHNMVNQTIISKHREIGVLEDKARAAGVDVNVCKDADPNFDALMDSAIKNFKLKISTSQNKNKQNVTQSTDFIVNYKINSYQNLKTCKDLSCINKIKTQTDLNQIKSAESACLQSISNFIDIANSTENVSEKETSQTIKSKAELMISCLNSAIDPTKDTLQKRINQLQAEINSTLGNIGDIETNTTKDFEQYREQNVTEMIRAYNKTAESIKNKEESFGHFKHTLCTDLEEDFEDQENSLIGILNSFNQTYHSIIKNAISHVTVNKELLSSINKALEKCKDEDTACLKSVNKNITNYEQNAQLNNITDNVSQNIINATTTMQQTARNIDNDTNVKGLQVRSCLSKLSDTKDAITVDNLIKQIDETKLLDILNKTAQTTYSTLDSNLTKISDDKNKIVNETRHEIEKRFNIIIKCAQFDITKEHNDSLAKFDLYVNQRSLNVSSSVSHIKTSINTFENNTLDTLGMCKDYDCLKKVNSEFLVDSRDMSQNITKDLKYIESILINDILNDAKVTISESFVKLFELALECFNTLNTTANDIKQADQTLNKTILNVVNKITTLQDKIIGDISEKNKTYLQEVTKIVSIETKNITAKTKTVSKLQYKSCSKVLNDFDNIQTRDCSTFNSHLNNRTSQVKSIIGKALNNAKVLYPTTFKTWEELGQCTNQTCVSTTAADSVTNSQKSIEICQSILKEAEDKSSKVLGNLTEIVDEYIKLTNDDVHKKAGEVLHCLNSSYLATPSLGLLLVLLVTQLSKFIY